MRPPRPPPPAWPATTLWDFPSRTYDAADTPGGQGRDAYRGSTPAGVIHALLARFTRPKDLVVDPMAGSGTTLDVARELGRRALGYDLNVTRPDVFRADARATPLEDGKADFVFADPPYSTHLEYSRDPRCIGRLDAATPAYYEAMERVFDDWVRILRPDRYGALYVGDSFVKDRGFYPIGFELFRRLSERFTPIDVVAVVRHNRTLSMGNYRRAAEEGGFMLRGFQYLFIFYKPPPPRAAPRALLASDAPPAPESSAAREKRPRRPRP